MNKILILTNIIAKSYLTEINKRNGGTLYDLVDYKDTKVVIGENINIFVNDRNIDNYDVVMLRGYNKHYELSSTIAKYLQSKNKKIYSSFLLGRSYGSKLFQVVKCSLDGILVPKSVFIPSIKILENINFIKKELKLPFVMKAISASGGSNNHLIRNLDDIKNNLDTSVDYIFQEFIPNSFDYRVVVYDYENIVSAEKRIRQSKSDHRNNAKLGAIEEFLDVNLLEKDIKVVSKKICKALELEIGGVDLIRSDEDKKLYFIEANSTPGITLDTLEETGFVNYIKSLKQK